MNTNAPRTLAIALCAAALAACAPATKPVEPTAKPGETRLLTEGSPSYLYLAAQRAIRNQRYEQAIQLLRRLVNRDATATLPRLQLAELLLRRGRAEEALTHLDALLAGEALSGERRTGARLLRARALATADRKEEAIDALDRLLAERPGHRQARLLLIRLHLENADVATALQIVREGIAAGDAPELRQIQAQIYLRAGALEKAVDSLEAMYELAPDSEVAALMLSQAYARQGRPGDAEMLLREHLKRNPTALQTANALGRMLVRQKRIGEAITIYRDLLERTDGAPEVRSALGLLYYQREAYEEAAAQFREVVGGRPDAAPERFYLGASLEALGRVEEAVEWYGGIEPDDEPYDQAQLRLAGIEMRGERYDRAAARLKRLLTREPEEAAHAYTLLSLIRLNQERHEQLIRETESAVEAETFTPQLLFNRAVAFESLGNFPRLKESLEAALELDPDYAEALNFLGYAYAERGTRLDEAERLIRRALKLRPDDGYYLDSLAWVHYRRGDFAAALEAQRRAVSRVGDDPVMQDHLGDILWRSGDAEAARRAWRRAIELHHASPGKLRRKIREGLEPS